MKVLNAFNYVEHNSTDDGVLLIGEKFSKPSLTVPEEPMTMREIYERFAGGRHVEQFSPVYDEEGIIPPNLERMNPMERLDYARTLATRIDTVKKSRKRSEQLEISEETVRPSLPGVED